MRAYVSKVIGFILLSTLIIIFSFNIGTNIIVKYKVYFNIRSAGMEYAIFIEVLFFSVMISVSEFLGHPVSA